MTNDPLIIAGKAYNSRLLVGSGKYKDLEETRLATEASNADIITVAIRRTNIGQNPDEPNLLDIVPAEQIHHPAQYRRLLQRRGRSAHLPSGPRTARWTQTSETGSVG